MKYKTIEIRPIEGQWVALRGNIGGERAEEKTAPNHLGFYHYPVTISDAEAFADLKAVLVERHQAEIDQLQNSLDKLKELELG